MRRSARLASMPVTMRFGNPKCVRETSAWTSSMSGRVPSRRGHDDRARRTGALIQENFRRALDPLQAFAGHAENAHFVRRAQSGSYRSAGAGRSAPARNQNKARCPPYVRALAGRRCPLPWSRGRAQNGHAAGFGQAQDFRRALAHLPDRARSAGHVFTVGRLDGIDHAEGGRDLFDRLDDFGNSVSETSERSGTDKSQPVRAVLDLLERFFSGNIKPLTISPFDSVRQAPRHAWSIRVDFPIPGGPAEQNERTGDHSSAQDAVKFRHARRGALQAAPRGCRPGGRSRRKRM